MSISESDLCVPSQLGDLTYPPYVSHYAVRVKRAKEARLTLGVCPECGGRATEEEMIVRRPGMPVIRRIVLRCWRPKGIDKARCRIVILSETTLEGEDDFPYSEHTSGNPGRARKSRKTPAMVRIEDLRESPKEAVPPRLCEDCGVDIGDRANNARLCRTCAKARYTKSNTERHRQKRVHKGPRYCATCGIDIGSLHIGCKICISCAEKKLLDAESVQRAPLDTLPKGPDGRPIRHCVDCGADISARILTCIRCSNCVLSLKRLRSRVNDHKRSKEIRNRG